MSEKHKKGWLRLLIINDLFGDFDDLDEWLKYQVSKRYIL